MTRTVWITGAGSGIGAAMARAFAGAGYAVALTARGTTGLESVAAGITAAGGAVTIHEGDVTDRAGMADLARSIARATGGIHVLCNNAGLNIPKRRWDQLDWASWDEVVEVNLTGALNVIAATLPVMRRQNGGVMIHTSSWAGRFHSPGGGAIYGATKHALTSLSASLNAEEGTNGIRSTALCPAEVATPLLARRPGFDPGDLPAMIQPEDMAATALYVAAMNPGVAVHEITLAPVRGLPRHREPSGASS